MRTLKGLILSICTVVLLFSNNVVTYAKPNQEVNEITALVKNYEQAAINKDIDLMVELSNDLRWPSSYRMKKNLASLDDQPTEFRLLELNKVESDLYQARIQLAIDKTEPKQVILPIYFDGFEWKIVVGQDFPENSLRSFTAQAQDQYNSIMNANYYRDYFDQSSVEPVIQPFASSVEYYSFTFSSGNPGSVDSDTWNNTNSRPSIKGWQEPNGGYGNWIDMDYELREPTLFGSSYVASYNVTGMYEETGTWYYKVYNNIPVNEDLFLRIRCNDASYTVYGAGNVYN